MSQDHSQDHTQPLAQLLDIHAAAEPGLWPPAPGWWLLGLVLLVLLFFGIRRLVNRLSVHRRRQTWLRELVALPAAHDPGADPHGYLASVNRLFRAVALRAFPGTECARLEGERWVAFISGLMPEGTDSAALSVLARGPYEPEPDFDDTGLDEQGFADEDDDFDPTEEIPSDQSIEFPTDI